MDAKLAKLAKAVGPLTRDLIGLAGVTLIALGCWMAWPPLGIIVAGILLLVAAIKWAARWG